MLTSPAGVEVVRDDRAPYRPFWVSVAARTALSPHFTRITFTGPELEWFGRDSLDQRIKLILPLPEVGLPDLDGDPTGPEPGDWYPRWLALPDPVRNPLRTYTVRDVRPSERELDVAFVVHPVPGGTPGPAGAWLARARVGDELLIVGPDARSRSSATGIDWRPGAARHVLLAGDETAVPAILGILRSLRPEITGTVLIEIPTAADEQPVETKAALDVRWLVRHPDERGRVLHGALTGWVMANAEVVRAAAAPAPQRLEDVDIETGLLWEAPDRPADEAGAEFYAWLAGEAGVIKRLRRLLVAEAGIDRRRVAFMGYWREGRAELS